MRASEPGVRHIAAADFSSLAALVDLDFTFHERRHRYVGFLESPRFSRRRFFRRRARARTERLAPAHFHAAAAGQHGADRDIARHRAHAARGAARARTGNAETETDAAT